MGTDPPDTPIVLDGVVSEEKLSDLLALGAEYPELDFKDWVDPRDKRSLVELAVTVGSMEVRGGYIVVGVDNNGSPTGGIDAIPSSLFDEATLAPKLLRYLPEPLHLRSNVLRRGEHDVALIYVGPHPSGCAFFRAIGQYEDNGQTTVKFRAGEVFWRNGTRSERVNQQGFEEIMAQRLRREKRLWFDEQQELRRTERSELEQAYRSQERARGPLGAVSPDLAPAELSAAVLELARDNDEIAFRSFLNDTLDRARQLIDRGEIGPELADLLDKLACVSATLLRFNLGGWFRETINSLGEVFDTAFSGQNAEYFGYSVALSPTETGPRLWLMVIERVYAVGALAVRVSDWDAVRYIATMKPKNIGDYYANWLRFGLTMASRAQHLTDHEGGQAREISLLSLARGRANELECLRQDGVTDEDLLSSLAQFDLLSNIAAVAAVGATDDRVFYPSWARLRQSRVDPIVERLATEPEMRHRLTAVEDNEVARALALVSQLAARVGIYFDGFRSWERSASIARFLESNRGSAEPTGGTT